MWERGHRHSLSIGGSNAWCNYNWSWLTLCITNCRSPSCYSKVAVRDDCDGSVLVLHNFDYSIADTVGTWIALLYLMCRWEKILACWKHILIALTMNAESTYCLCLLNGLHSFVSCTLLSFTVLVLPLIAFQLKCMNRPILILIKTKQQLDILSLVSCYLILPCHTLSCCHDSLPLPYLLWYFNIQYLSNSCTLLSLASSYRHYHLSRFRA